MIICNNFTIKVQWQQHTLHTILGVLSKYVCHFMGYQFDSIHNSFVFLFQNATLFKNAEQSRHKNVDNVQE